MQNTFWRNNKDKQRLLYKKYTSHFIWKVVCERELETKQNCNILTPTLMAISIVSFLFSRVAQPEARGPSFLLSAGFLYHILSPTSGLQNSRGPEGPFCRVLFSLQYLVSKLSELQTNWLPVFTELYNSSMPPSSCGRHNCTHSTHPRSRW